jgi:hypothetical protein
MIFHRKLASVRSSISDARTRGISALSAPLSTAFQSFQGEFDRALSNIDIIFERFNSRIQDCLLTYTEVNHLPDTVKSLEAQISELAEKQENAMRDAESTRTDIVGMMASSRDAIVLQFRRRLDSLTLRIEVLETNSSLALSQSESAITDAQAIQLEFRQQFARALDVSMTGFTRRVQAMKTSIMELRKARMSQIESARSRVIEWSDEARKTRNESIETKGRVSLQPEIRALKQELRQLKRKLKQKWAEQA